MRRCIWRLLSVTRNVRCSKRNACHLRAHNKSFLLMFVRVVRVSAARRFLSGTDNSCQSEWAKPPLAPRGGGGGLFLCPNYFHLLFFGNGQRSFARRARTSTRQPHTIHVEPYPSFSHSRHALRRRESVSASARRNPFMRSTASTAFLISSVLTLGPFPQRRQRFMTALPSAPQRRRPAA